MLYEKIITSFKNSVLKLYKPIGGMCNTISGEYIKDNQACSISGVIYNEDTNTFQGSPAYKSVSSFAGRKFARLFNVEYNGKNAVFCNLCRRHCKYY